MAEFLYCQVGIAEDDIKGKVQAYQKELWKRRYQEIYDKIYMQAEAKLRQAIEAELRPKILAELHPIATQAAESKLRANLKAEAAQEMGRMKQELLSRDAVVMQRKYKRLCQKFRKEVGYWPDSDEDEETTPKARSNRGLD